MGEGSWEALGELTGVGASSEVTTWVRACPGAVVRLANPENLDLARMGLPRCWVVVVGDVEVGKSALLERFFVGRLLRTSGVVR
jgi:hypothetical protein